MADETCRIVGTFPHDPYPSCVVHLGKYGHVQPSVKDASVRPLSEKVNRTLPLSSWPATAGHRVIAMLTAFRRLTSEIPTCS